MKDEVMSSCSSTSSAAVEIEVCSDSTGERKSRCNNCYNCNCVEKQVIEGFKRYRRSTAPSRILFYRNRRWSDFPPNIFEELRSAFVAGKTTVELSGEGRMRNHLIVDFLRMVQIGYTTSSSSEGISLQKNLIAWIDVNEQCFFPQAAVSEGGGEEFLSNYRDSDSSEEEEEEEGEKRKREGLKMLFVNGMMKKNKAVEVTGVHKCSSSSSSTSGVMMKNKKASFEMVMGMTEEARGNANVRFAWYGAPADAVTSVVKHGFWRNINNGSLAHHQETHGVALHLSPHHLPFQSSLLSEADVKGERQMVLCRVIMGRSERVEAGSTQYQPCSEEFDSGMDDLLNPEWYLVWSTHINTHILPEYVVTFKTSSGQHYQGSQPSFHPKRPSIRSSFQKLLSEIAKSLPSPTMQALENLYLKHKAGKVSRDAFIRHLRSMAGDKLLASTIKRIRGC